MLRSLRAAALLLLCLAFAQAAHAALGITIEDPNDPNFDPDGVPVSLSKLVAGKITGATGTVAVKLQVDDDALNATTAQVINTGYLGSVTLTTDHHTITATATETPGGATASATVNVFGDPPPGVTISAPISPVFTGDVTVRVMGTVTDTGTGFDPNDPNTLVVNGDSVPVDPNGAFDGPAPVTLGSHKLSFVVSDKVGNVTTVQGVFVTRTAVCQNPTFPTIDNTDPNAAHLITVDRTDDLPLRSFDPNDPNQFNDPNACDIRPNPPGTTFDPPSTGKCTLRAALQVANAHPGVDLIRLPNKVVTLTRKGPGEDLGLTGDLDVRDDLMVVGRGRDISVVDGRKLGDRIFDVQPGVAFTILAATLQRGQTQKKDPEPQGGCIRFAGGPLASAPEDKPQLATFTSNTLALLQCKSAGEGGALALLQDPNLDPAELPDPKDPNQPADPNDPSAVSVSRMTCTVVARSSAKSDGGAIFVQDESLSLRNSTIALNSASGQGGGIALSGGRFETTNATISSNKAKTGGGLALADGARARLNNVTLAQNSAKLGASLSTADDAGGANTLDVSNTILGDKPKKTCDLTTTSPLVSKGHNIDPGNTCDLPPDELVDVDPRVDKLATNVGTPTQALKSDSPAIDNGDFATCQPLDERDVDRVNGPGGPPSTSPDQCDIGAFEFASTPSSP